MNRILDLPLSLRLPICAIALMAIVAVFANKTFPDIPPLFVFAWAVGAVAVAGVLLIAYFVVVAGMHTWSLDGENDAQWLCLDGEPPAMHGLHDEWESPDRQHD